MELKKRVLTTRQADQYKLWQQNVLVCLNGELPKNLCSTLARPRIAALVDALKHLSHEAKERGSTKEMNRWAKRVNELMSRYRSRKMVWWDSDYRLDFGDDFGEIDLRKRLEANAAHSAIYLAEIGALDGLRTCLCGRWFLAQRNAQKSCSPACRHKLYEQTDAFKAMRREYMKKYYRLTKAANVK
jgi:hypothetical protein